MTVPETVYVAYVDEKMIAVDDDEEDVRNETARIDDVVIVEYEVAKEQGNQIQSRRHVDIKIEREGIQAALYDEDEDQFRTTVDEWAAAWGRLIEHEDTGAKEAMSRAQQGIETTRVTLKESIEDDQ